MKTETIAYCVFALILGMLLANMLKSVCGCKVVEGLSCAPNSNYYTWMYKCSGRQNSHKDCGKFVENCQSTVDNQYGARAGHYFPRCQQIDEEQGCGDCIDPNQGNCNPGS